MDEQSTSDFPHLLLFRDTSPLRGILDGRELPVWLLIHPRVSLVRGMGKKEKWEERGNGRVRLLAT